MFRSKGQAGVVLECTDEGIDIILIVGGNEDVIDVSGIYPRRGVAVEGLLFHVCHIHVRKENTKWGSHSNSIYLSEEVSSMREERGFFGASLK